MQIATTAELARKETPTEIYEKQPLKFNDRVMYRKAVLNEQTTEYDQQDEYFYYNDSPGFSKALKLAYIVRFWISEITKYCNKFIFSVKN